MIYLAIVILGVMGILETVLRFLLVTIFVLFSCFMGLAWVETSMFESRCFTLTDKLVNRVVTFK